MDLLKKIEVTEELCKFCKWTHFGTVEVNTRFGNLCEGRNCENAYKHKKYMEQCEIEEDEECSGCRYAPYSKYKDTCVDCQAE